MINMMEMLNVRGNTEGLNSNYDKCIVVNRIACGDARDQKENMDPDFGNVWKQTLYGGILPKTHNPN